MEWTLLTGVVSAYPDDTDKGLLEVTISAYEEETETVRARVSRPCAGWYLLPEIGDVVEVLLPTGPGAEARVLDVRLPEGDAFVEACWTESNDVKRFVSRAGCTLSLCDTEDETSIRAETPGKLSLTLDDKEKKAVIQGEDGKTALTLDMENGEVTLCADKKLTLSCGGASLEIDSSGNVTLHAEGTLKLTGQEVQAAAQNGLQLEGQQTTLTGKLKAEVTGQTGLDLTSNGITQVKGTMVKLN